MRSEQQCCYNSDGNLIIGPSSGGSVDRVSPNALGNFILNFFQHQLLDIIPLIYCCKGIHSAATCGLYYLRRPSARAQGGMCDPPVPG